MPSVLPRQRSMIPMSGAPGAPIVIQPESPFEISCSLGPMLPRASTVAFGRANATRPLRLARYSLTERWLFPFHAETAHDCHECVQAAGVRTVKSWLPRRLDSDLDVVTRTLREVELCGRDAGDVVIPFGAGGGGRTHMPSEGRGILSPVRLPVPPLQLEVAG